MKNTHWNQIVSGQIVTFRYKSEGDRILNSLAKRFRPFLS